MLTKFAVGDTENIYYSIFDLDSGRVISVHYIYPFSLVQNDFGAERGFWKDMLIISTQKSRFSDCTLPFATLIPADSCRRKICEGIRTRQGYIRGGNRILHH